MGAFMHYQGCLRDAILEDIGATGGQVNIAKVIVMGEIERCRLNAVIDELLEAKLLSDDRIMRRCVGRFIAAIGEIRKAGIERDVKKVMNGARKS